MVLWQAVLRSPAPRTFSDRIPPTCYSMYHQYINIRAVQIRKVCGGAVASSQIKKCP
jgi:hypothetical protein